MEASKPRCVAFILDSRRRRRPGVRPAMGQPTACTALPDPPRRGQWRSQTFQPVMSFHICDVKYMDFHNFYINFCIIYTSIQRICQKPVWSIDHTAINVAPPLVEAVEAPLQEHAAVAACGDPAYHCMCSMQIVDITPMKHHLTSITSIRVVQQKHHRSKVGA
jgi:hypothetical protein